MDKSQLTPIEIAAQKLQEARFIPDSIASIEALRNLATPGHWQELHSEPEDNEDTRPQGPIGILAVLHWEEKNGAEEGSSSKEVALLDYPHDLHKEANIFYICRLHNLFPRLMARLRKAEAVVGLGQKWVSISEQPPIEGRLILLIDMVGNWVSSGRFHKRYTSKFAPIVARLQGQVFCQLNSDNFIQPRCYTHYCYLEEFPETVEGSQNNG